MSMPWFVPMNGDRTTPNSSIRDLIDLQIQQKMIEILSPKTAEPKKEEPKKPKFTYLKILVAMTLCFPGIAIGYALMTLKLLQAFAKAAQPLIGTN